jgi:hypothetical protein
MKKLLFYAACVLLGANASAQFAPPNAAFTETTYPPTFFPNPVGTTANVSCYSLPVGWGGGSGYGTVSSWDDPANGSGIAWQVVTGTTMAATVDQGYLSYPVGTTSINVGIIHGGPSGIMIDVSYHRAGVGHFYDIYAWQQPLAFGGPGGVTLITTQQLSTVTSATRISMDTHIGYGTGIVWEDPANGINIIAATNNNFGPPFTLNGTNGHTDPDVAFTHAGPLDLHVVSWDPLMGIYEYYVTWFDIIPGGMYAIGCAAVPPFSTCPLINTVEDVNAVMLPVVPRLHIDAPDHYGPANWTYVYTDNTYGGVPATINLTDGSYPNAPFLPAINTSGNSIPVVAYGMAPTNLYVGWHTGYNDPSYNPSSTTYVGIELLEDGAIVNPIAPFNFMAVNQVPTWTSPTPAMYFSKQNDQTSNLYLVFAQYDGIDNMVQHKLVPWGSGSFKGGVPQYVEDMSQHHHDVDVTMSPNPFSKAIALNVPAHLAQEDVTMYITDITGRSIAVYEGTFHKINGYLKDLTNTLATGQYLADVRIVKTGYHNVFKLSKTE